MRLDYKLSTNRAAWTGSGEFLNLPLRHFLVERIINREALSKTSVSLRSVFFGATTCPEKKKKKNRIIWAERRCVEVAYCVAKEIPSTAPTSVDPCLSKRPARWLMEPTYVTDISIPKCAGRREALQRQTRHHYHEDAWYKFKILIIRFYYNFR